ncbi:DNA polymerase III, epsilon subunit [Rosenbergiella nectarea]|uniref:DNA polymerase III, epsilon subunit n=1 Tax=Rosenbergiella nectarea TaxID=988801 RepID=A0A1H9F221_9GAMM|nr:3'-5' exonuclease [Rosenbergiella nectarea]SEQ31992.1 DNA polymerase III, epsilon subunit [Rosenbergiella nectarea]
MISSVATCRAKKWVEKQMVIIDTETTGLGDDAEIIEVAALRCDGKIMLNTLVKPLKPIPVSATAIHGITNEMIANAPSWPEVIGQLILAAGSDDFLAYNSAFDARLIKQTTYEHYGVISVLFERFHERHCCVMDAYAMYRGIKKGDGYKKHKLIDAAEHEGVVIEGSAHRALSDCLLTLELIKVMAKGDGHE